MLNTIFNKNKYFDRAKLLMGPIKTAKLARFIAKFIDFFLVIILTPLYYPLGGILGTIYLAISDSLMQGQSLGKKIIGFSVISLEDGRPCTLKQSVIRNLPFLIPQLFCLIPLWGWVLAIILGIPLMVLEIYLLINMDSGKRLGDVMADTSVMGHDGHLTGKNKKKMKTSWFSTEENTVSTPVNSKGL
jgi:uncharacterized RDD family membrane protein YckC